MDDIEKLKRAVTLMYLVLGGETEREERIELSQLIKEFNGIK